MPQNQAVKGPKYPEISNAEHLHEMLNSMKMARPYTTTFLFLEEGCAAVGQSTELAKAIEKAMKNHFEIWASSWITWRLEEMQAKLEASNAQ